MPGGIGVSRLDVLHACFKVVFKGRRSILHVSIAMSPKLTRAFGFGAIALMHFAGMSMSVARASTYLICMLGGWTVKLLAVGAEGGMVGEIAIHKTISFVFASPYGIYTQVSRIVQWFQL